MWGYILATGGTICGMLVALYMYTRLKTKRQMRCFLGGQCNEVLFSPYARIWRISNPLIGIMYFCMVGLYLILHGLGILPTISITVVRVFVVISIVFALWLTFLRMVVLKKMCEWCHLAVICTCVTALGLFLLTA